VLSGVRRRDDWLEVRVVNEGGTPSQASLEMRLTEARTADLLGRPRDPLPVSGDGLALDLGPWEIQTVQVR
jgi:alpha-mannosidase